MAEENEGDACRVGGVRAVMTDAVVLFTQTDQTLNQPETNYKPMTLKPTDLSHFTSENHDNDCLVCVSVCVCVCADALQGHVCCVAVCSV